MTDDAKRDPWRREVLAWAQRACVESDERGLRIPSSDLVSALWRDAAGAERATAGGCALPVVGDAARSACFDAEALHCAGMVRDFYPGVAAIAVCVGRVLVYVWALAPGGGAEVIWLHEGALRADVARHDDGDGSPAEARPC